MKKVLVLISIIMVLGTIGCTVKKDSITNDEAVSAIKNYCYKNNPDLEEMEKSQDHTVYWEVESSDDKQTVVVFRSYTGALVRYYIYLASGDTYVTEFVPGIMNKEEQTEERFNIKDYLS